MRVEEASLDLRKNWKSSLQMQNFLKAIIFQFRQQIFQIFISLFKYM